MSASEAVAAPRAYPHRGKARATILDAARRLAEEKGENFTTQELIKEAGVALQTFYRHFGGKDQLMVALITELVAENCVLFAEHAAELDDPVERIHLYVSSALESLRAGHSPGPRFITSEHLRLHTLFPEEMDGATRPYAEMIATELRAAEQAGLLRPADPDRDAWLITRVVTSVYYHYSFLLDDPKIGTIAEDVWQFCLAAVGGNPSPTKRRPLTRRK